MALAYQQRIMQQGKFSPVFLQCDTGMPRFGWSDIERQSLTTSLGQQSVSHIDDDAIEEGSIVEFIGEHQSISDIALCCGTIDYEILTRIGNRYTKSMLRGVTGDD